MTRLVVLALAVVTVAAVLGGCGGSAPDKAGNPSRSETELTLASSLGDPNELQAFADEVARRSDGALKIRFVSNWREGETDYEQGLIRDVAAGKADLGWVGSRALPAFDALTAPFVVDRYELEGKVLESSLPDTMLKSLGPLGVEGLGVLPGPLRYVLAAPRPLLRPADFAALRVGYQPGPARDTLRALGATPVALSGGQVWEGLDAIEQQVASINGNGYDLSAKHLTANAPLWPRPMVVIAGRRALADLPSEQRDVLRAAARAAVPEALAIARRQQRVALAALCRRGVEPATASAQDLAALRAAVAPVLAKLRRDSATRAALEEIDAMRATTRPEPALACPTAATRPAAATLPDGTWTTDITRADMLASGVQHELSAAEERDMLGSTWTLVVRRGVLFLYVNHPDGRREVNYQGDLSVYRDRFTVTSRGSGFDGVVRGRFEVEGDTLRFSDVTPAPYYPAVFASQPWQAKR